MLFHRTITCSPFRYAVMFSDPGVGLSKSIAVAAPGASATPAAPRRKFRRSVVFVMMAPHSL